MIECKKKARQAKTDETKKKYMRKYITLRQTTLPKRNKKILRADGVNVPRFYSVNWAQRRAYGIAKRKGL